MLRLRPRILLQRSAETALSTSNVRGGLERLGERAISVLARYRLGL
jgi:hypothetical protein